MDKKKLSVVTEEANSAVVASLSEKSTHPFSSIALSPNRKHAVLSGKDSLQLVNISPQGIKSLRNIKISQHFRAPVNPTNRRSQTGKVYGDVRDTFISVSEQAPHPRPGMAHGNVVVTYVAWSNPQTKGGEGTHDSMGDAPNREDETTDTLIAASGSNGIVAIWSARQLLFSKGSGGSSSLANQQPEAILSQHTRAVNSLAWHPRRPGLLLTASQDATVRLWERREVTSKSDQESNARRSFGFFNKAQTQNLKSYSWVCRATFEPKSEAVRDVQWSKFQDDIFAIVSVSGSLVIYSSHVPSRALVKVAAHTGDATSLDWHPKRPFILATGGSGDRCVKVWDLESCINMSKTDEAPVSYNANTWNTIRSEISTNSYSSSETEKSGGFTTAHVSNLSIHGARALAGNPQGSSIRVKSSAAAILHVLSISSSVTRLRWRPPANDNLPPIEDDISEVDRHDSMLAVASARLTSAGGSGALSLWSFHRPFMALSVVEGHKEGAVADFVWLETPQIMMNLRKPSKISPSESNLSSSKHDSRRLLKMQMQSSQEEAILVRSNGRNDVESILFDSKDKDNDEDKFQPLSIWQHVLSVGRDGQCMLQSFARGDRPISRVPSSCFAMANLSPFQSGYGSLQCFSVYQKVPNKANQDYLLTGLRQDEHTAMAPGVFRELPLEDDESSDQRDEDSWISGQRLPNATPDLVFNVIDQGDLGEDGLPQGSNSANMCIAPEVVHLSRFADMYKFYPDARLPTRVDLCLHNSDVAEKLRCGPLARMWRSIASMLDGAGFDDLPNTGPLSQPTNIMQFALFPTIRSLLEERAEAGDVQTCVAICEVLQVIQSDEQTRIPGLDLNLVREWYLAYIDLLQQMCLFSAASYLIRSCKDPKIGALNQQSTTIHESCPRCGKPLHNDGTGPMTANPRRVCMNCRRKVGLCFLCHEPVKGMFVWCPGCGHGGHLEHALQWFGGLSGTPVREVCPTGCGHRCNFTQTLSAFPRTDSIVCLQSPDIPETLSK